jgi:hypothetical protein
MSRQTRKQLPLELRWRIVDTMPEGDREIEIAYCRFLAESTRITLARKQGHTFTEHPLLTMPVSAIVTGWGVRVNGEDVTPEPLSFLDALYQGLSVFVEAIPRMAQVVTQATSIRAQREGWDAEQTEVRVEYATGGGVATGGTMEAGTGSGGPHESTLRSPDGRSGTPGTSGTEGGR